MGREVRRVSKDWQHPKGPNGRYIPLLEETYEEAVRKHEQFMKAWNSGEPLEYKYENEARDRGEDPKDHAPYLGEPSDYMPSWPEEERTHIQMYETCSEGTPISPPMKTPEELARWLADNKASAFGDRTASYEQWLATCRSGWAPSAMMSPETGLVSGVEYGGLKG